MTFPSDSNDEAVLSSHDIAAMSLPMTQNNKQALLPNEPAEDPTLDERLIVNRSTEQVSPPATSEEEHPQEEAVPRYFFVKQQKINLGSLAHTKPSKLKDEEVTMVTVLPLPSTTPEGVEACVNNSNPRSVDPKWLDTLDRSQKLFYDSTEHQDALTREGSSWNNRPLTDGNQPLTIHRLRAAIDGESELTAERASLAIRSHIGLGTIVNIPLWNSGLWVTIRDPGDAAIQNAVRNQTTERMRVGRSTHALGFSNFMVFTIETLSDLVISNITATTAHSDVNLLNNISIHDFGTMILGLASAIYPNGFEYSRACTSGPDKCTHITREILNLNTCLFDDETKLTKEQRIHMSNMKKGWAKESDLQRYRDQFTANLGFKQAIKASNGSELTLTLKVPTIGECIEAGQDWVGMVSNFVNEALGLDADNEHRNQYQQDIALVTAAGQFTQWVKEITVGQNPITNPRTLRDVFYNDISPDTVLLDNLKNAIKEFSTKSMVSVVGILNYTCPACHKPQMVAEGDNVSDPKQALPLLIAIDPVSTFLELMYRRFLAIRQRS